LKEQPIHLWLAAAQKLRAVPRLENLPNFELVLKKKKVNKKHENKSEKVQEVQNNNGNNTNDQNNQSELNESLRAFLNLKFEVGLITEIGKLPKSDKLFLEKIKLATEETPRNVCSGLAP